MLDTFRDELISQGKSSNTVGSYLAHVKKYCDWYREAYAKDMVQLYWPNVQDYKKHLDSKGLKRRSINSALSALIKLNEFLIGRGIQKDMVISSTDYFRIQQNYASPATVTKKEVEAFRQDILEEEKKRDYALVTLMAYTGLRITEALDLKLSDVNLTTREIIIKNGKGSKQRVVFLNEKITNALREYFKERKGFNEHLFLSREGKRMSRTRVNQIFCKYSDKITPHTLRHFFCSNALEAGYSIHEVANQAGHSNIHTTLLYTNPDKSKLKEKANLL